MNITKTITATFPAEYFDIIADSIKTQGALVAVEDDKSNADKVAEYYTEMIKNDIKAKAKKYYDTEALKQVAVQKAEAVQLIDEGISLE